MEIAIIGSGKMAQAVVEGIYKEVKVKIVARDEEKLKMLKERFKGVEIETLKDGFNIEGLNVMLCVKPFALKEVSEKLKGKANALLSVLAGVEIEKLKSCLKADYYIRIMPNLAASYQKSMTTLTGDEGFKKEALFICEKFGRALWLNSEKEIDIATAIAGSGPAFLALAAEALADGGVNMGLKREDSYALVRGLFEGFYALLEKKHPAVIKDEVMSPGGTTAAGYEALEEKGVRDGFIKAVKRAYERAAKR